ncbi:MAG TPA: HlyD family secretion protein, partial [Bryobacterales bacterium]|nr:HlyD family secretion protein [Bryobacterales bacterium]
MADVVEVENQQTERRSLHGAGHRLRPRAGSHARWLLLGLVIVVAVGAYAAWRYYAVRESTDDAQIDGHITPISARVGGTVLAVHVNDNQYVEAGTVLVEIDPRDYQVALQSTQADLAAEQAKARSAQTGVPITSTTTSSRLRGAQAGVEAANAALNAAQQEVSAARAQLDAARARVRQAEANHQKAARDLDRMKQLIAKDEISQQQYDAAVAAEAASRASVESARAEVARAAQAVPVAESHVAQDQAAVAQAQAGVDAARTGPQEVAVSRAEFGNAQAKIQQAEADVSQARLNLEYTTVHAPVSGTVSNKTVQVGQVIQPGQPLLAIVPLEDIWVTANFKETQLRHMQPGQPAIISVDAYGREYRGHVDSVAAATGARFSLLPPENASGNYVKVVQRVPVKILFE